MQELENYELFEVYTDRKGEEPYKAMQQELTGYMANPTYLVLEPKNLLEVTRSAYTPSAEEYMDFVKRGQSKTPAFRSLVLTGGNGRIAAIDVPDPGRSDEHATRRKKIAVLEPISPVVADVGEFFSQADANELPSKRRRAYRRAFGATQTFKLAAGVPAGEYSIEVKLITPIYENGEFVEIVSRLKRFAFNVSGS